MDRIKIECEGEMYKLQFPSYDFLLDYMKNKKPSQMCISFDGEHLTGSVPVAAYTVRVDKE